MNWIFTGVGLDVECRTDYIGGWLKVGLKIDLHWTERWLEVMWFVIGNNNFDTRIQRNINKHKKDNIIILRVETKLRCMKLERNCKHTADM